MDMLVSWRMAVPLALLCVASATAKPTYAQTVETHARVSLIAPKAFPPRSQPMWVGLLFQLDPGWHIYWQNAGDSGEPPKVQWQLPEGFRAGPIRWPTPIRLGSGTVVDYGYQGQVLLMAPIERLAVAKADSVSAIAADVKYVVCREICIPGKAHLTVSFPAGEDALSQAAQWQKLFQGTQMTLPKPTPVEWKVSAQSDEDQFVLAVEGTLPPREAFFFPLEPGIIENSAPQTLERSENGFRLTLRKSDSLINSVSALRGLLVLPNHRGFEITAPVGK
jgi:DsbC/DsbD-like thiol-disulfide interchange protein